MWGAGWEGVGVEAPAEGCAAVEERGWCVGEVENGALAVAVGFCWPRAAISDRVDGRSDESARRR